MTDADIAPLPTEPPTGSPLELSPPSRWSRRPKVRPWWGLGDVWLGLVTFLLLAVLGNSVGELFATDSSNTIELAGVSMPVVVAAMSLYAQQVGQAVWPLIVARWKGFGATIDWRLGFKFIDVPLGIGTAFIAAGAAAIAGAIVSGLVGLDDPSEAENTQILTDTQNTAWIWFLVYAATVIAPVAEELFFRGLALRAFEKRGGPILAVVGSTVVFTVLHYNGGDLAATAVLFAAIGAVGAVLAIVTLRVGRLWPAIFAHMGFNALGASQALGAFDALPA